MVKSSRATNNDICGNKNLSWFCAVVRCNSLREHSIDEACYVSTHLSLSLSLPTFCRLPIQPHRICILEQASERPTKLTNETHEKTKYHALQQSAI